MVIMLYITPINYRALVSRISRSSVSKMPDKTTLTVSEPQVDQAN